MTETVVTTPNGAILFDRSVISEINEERFRPEGWRHAEPVTGHLRAAGRGNTQYVGNVPKQFVLRHFVRGGLVGKLIRDHYLFRGADATRSFLEWRLLAKMADSGLRVPRPAAARFVRRGPFYSADLITVRIPDVIPVSQRLVQINLEDDFFLRLGRSVHEFHAAGVYHADMNAYNLQIDSDGDLWMLDFDRGQLLAPGPWKQRTLRRLHRSLEKIAALDPDVQFDAARWEQFLEGYFSAARSE